jgi:hypothetical protein
VSPRPRLSSSRRANLWAVLLLVMAVPAGADDSVPIRDNFGGIGLIEMPSARMAPDGQLSLGASFFENTQRYNLGFQITPWLEGSFRYSGLEHFDYAYPVYYDRSFAFKARLWDESDIFPAVAVGINDVVGTGIYSGEYVVASKQFGNIDASMGLGWGRLGSTALFDNPLRLVSDSFKTRNLSTDPGGIGNFRNLFSGPSVGLFGGLAWHTPVTGLSLIAEYSSDEYTEESSRDNFKPRNQLNFGASYRMDQYVTLGVHWLYGRSIGGSVSFALDPTTDENPEKLGPPPTPVNIRTNAEQQQALETMVRPRGRSAATSRNAGKNEFVDALWRDDDHLEDIAIRGRGLVLTESAPRQTCARAVRLVEFYGGDIDAIILRSPGAADRRCSMPEWAAKSGMGHDGASDASFSWASGRTAPLTIDASSARSARDDGMRAIRHDARQQFLSVEAISLGESQATIYYSNRHYFREAAAVDRLVRILMADAPPGIESFRLVAMQDGVPQQEFNILRTPQERNFAQDDELAPLDPTTVVDGPPMTNPVLAMADRSSYPRLSWDVYPQLRQELFDPSNPFAVQVLLAAEGRLELLAGLSLNGEVETSLYDNFNQDRPDDSLLPHVRSDFLKYFAQGKTGIGKLDAEYRFRLAPEVFAVAKVGYLESMFSGVGGEVLWRPANQRWALGGDLYEVWQRDFDRLFGLRAYHVLTGHVSIYYASPWYDLNFAVRAGQYLARDRGITFEVTRRFSTGVEIGAFATRTNISAAQFGEGSFDKGIIIRIPLGWAAPIQTQGQLGIDLRPVQRDGGQRLIGDATLYEETRRTSEGEILLDRSQQPVP